MKRNRLITLLPSTDVDLGRWLLQHSGVSYREEPNAPVFHELVFWMWRAPASRYILFVPEKGKARYSGVDDILTYLKTVPGFDQGLIPDPDKEPDEHFEVMDLQHYARSTIGDELDRWCYYHLLQNRRAIWPSITTGVPLYQKAGVFVGMPVIRRLMNYALKLNAKNAQEALQHTYAGMERIDNMLSDGREFLVGGRLTLADLAVAASFAPIVLAQGYQGMLPNQVICPPEMVPVIQKMRESPTGRFIQRIYDQYRPVQSIASHERGVSEPLNSVEERRAA